MIKKCFILFFLVALLSGCATLANGPLFTKAPMAPTNKGTLYLFRPRSSLGKTPLVKINGKPFVALTVLGYSYVYLSPGVYQLVFYYGTFGDNFISEIEIKQGQDTFLQYYAYGFGSGQGVRDFSSAQALEELKMYRYIQPLNTDFKN